MKLSLSVSYPEDYPNVLPDLSLEPVEGDFSEEDLEALLNDMRTSVNNRLRFLHMMQKLMTNCSRVKKASGWR